MDMKREGATNTVGTTTYLGKHGITDRMEKDKVSGFL